METQQVQYAGFWWRFLAHIIDYLIISIVSSIILLPVYLAFGITAFLKFAPGYCENDPAEVIPLVFAILGLVVVASIISATMVWLYNAFMESSKYQATLGKMAVGLQVTDMNGERISFARATGRYFGKILSGMIILIGYLMAGFTEKKQALHDILAGCLVVKKTV